MDELAEGLPKPFQSSTRLTGFATEAPLDWREGYRLFQSSTRLTGFATWQRCQIDNVDYNVSILYEADGVCNRIRLCCSASLSTTQFQSSTRLTGFATAPSRKRLQAGGLEAIFARGGIMRQPGRGAVGLKWDFPSPGRVRTRTRGKNKYAIQKSSLLYSKNPRFGTGGLHKVAFALARRSRGPRGASTPRGRCARCVPPPPGARSTPPKRPPPC